MNGLATKKVTFLSYKTPREDFFKRFYEKRQSGETLYVEDFKGNACEAHYNYLMSLPVVGETLKELKKSGVPLPASEIDHVGPLFTWVLIVHNL